MSWETSPTFDSHGIYGSIPGVWVGSDAVDGDRGPWVKAPVGSIYIRKTSETAEPVIYEKRQAEGRDDDWGAFGGVHVLQQRIEYTDFTDGGSTSGTLVLNGTIPAGAFVIRSVLVNLTGFTGDTTATIQIGDGSDADRYSTGTPSVFTTATVLDLGAVSGVDEHATAVSTVTITVTSGSDFGLVTAGAATVRIYYYL